MKRDKIILVKQSQFRYAFVSLKMLFIFLLISLLNSITATDCFNFRFPILLGGIDGDTQITHTLYENGFIYMAGITTTSELKCTDSRNTRTIFISKHDGRNFIWI